MDDVPKSVICFSTSQRHERKTGSDPLCLRGSFSPSKSIDGHAGRDTADRKEDFEQSSPDAPILREHKPIEEPCRLLMLE
jgi:hypothetical protein